MNEKATDLERLRQLLVECSAENVDDALGAVNSWEAFNAFAKAAASALGPEGCVTGELERLEAENKSMLLHTKELERLREKLASVLELADTHASNLDHPLTSADELAVALHELLDEIPPKPNWDPA